MLAPSLSASLLTQATSQVSQSESREWQAAALAAFARQLPPGERGQVLTQALEAALAQPWQAHRDGAFTDLIAMTELTAQQRAQAVGAEMDMTYYLDTETLGPLVTILHGPELEQVYARLGTVREPGRRAKAQAAVIRAAASAPAEFFADGQPLCDYWPAGIDRAALTELLAASAWWIDRNGGDTDIKEIVDAILDVIGWWR